MSGDKAVWVVDSEEIEDRIRFALSNVPGISIAGFRNVCDAVDALRKSHQKPKVILGNYHAADLILEVAHQKSRYAGIRTAYVSGEDLSLLAESHNAGYVRIGKDGSFDGLADAVKKWAE